MVKLEAEIVGWCQSQDVCERFVEAYVRRQEKDDGYLQSCSRELGSTLDALAIVFNFQACIWQADPEDASKVNFVGWVNRAGADDDAREIVHMRHDGRVHFDDMTEV